MDAKDEDLAGVDRNAVDKLVDSDDAKGTAVVLGDDKSAVDNVLVESSPEKTHKATNI